MPIAAKKKRTRRYVPDLNRYHSFKSSKGTYIPFDCPDDLYGEYRDNNFDPDAIVFSVSIALSRLFNFPVNLVSNKLRELIRKVVAQSGPRLRCSSLRAVMEGRIPGFPKPTTHTHPRKSLEARTTLVLMDVMDTLVCHYLESQEDGLSLLDGEEEDQGREISLEEFGDMVKGKRSGQETLCEEVPEDTEARGGEGESTDA